MINDSIQKLIVLLLLQTFSLVHAEDYSVDSRNVVIDELGTIRGLIKPTTTAVLSSEISAQIEKLPFKNGDSFSKGETLVKFDCSLYLAQHSAAKAELEASKKNLENQEQLLQLNATSNIQVDLAAIEVKKSKANLSVTGITLNRCSIKAPYGGRVIETAVNQHESVGKDQELLSILNDKELEIEVIVPSKWLTWIKPDISFQFTVDETGKSYLAKISQIGAVVDPVSQTVPVKGLFQEEVEVLAGMSGAAYFEQADQN